MATRPSDAVIRFHTLNYGLLYPALLGTFIFTLLDTTYISSAPPWPILLAAYFALQHMEGATDRTRYGWLRGICDWIEMGLMLALFRAFGHFGTAPAVRLDDWSCTNLLAAATFALPVAGRIARNHDDDGHGGFYLWLSGLSGIAAFAVLLSLGWLSFGVTLAALLVYALGFQFFNAWLARHLPSTRRPPLSES